jgi:hypothetical protein
MMYFGVTLMMNFRMRALDERFLQVNWNDDSFSEVSVGRNCPKAMRITIHHCQVAIFVQVLFGIVLPKQLFTYLRGKR